LAEKSDDTYEMSQRQYLIISSFGRQFSEK